MSLIDKSAVKRFILDFAAQSRAHKFTRVSPAVLADIEAAVRDKCRKIVHIQPSMGKTVR